MKVMLLRATGRTGKHVLEYLLTLDFAVNCLVRNPEKIDISDEKLHVIKGTPENYDDLKKSIEGCECILSVLNISRTSDFPSSPLRSPKYLLSNVTKNLVQLAHECSIHRVIICSAWGVGDSSRDIPFWFDLTIRFSNIRYAYLDHGRQESELHNSRLQYTIVRPVGLINSATQKPVVESFKNQPKPKLLISRKNLAKFMVDAITREDLYRKTVVVSQ